VSAHLLQLATAERAGLVPERVGDRHAPDVVHERRDLEPLVLFSVAPSASALRSARAATPRESPSVQIDSRSAKSASGSATARRRERATPNRTIVSVTGRR
jgi:hypothetical protein